VALFPRSGAAVEAEDRPRRMPLFRPGEVREIGLALISGFAAAMALRTVLNWQGYMSTALWWYLVSLALLFVLMRSSRGAIVALDRFVAFLIWSVGAVACAALGWILVYVVVNGFSKLSLSFFTDDLGSTSALDKGGGMRHALIGTIEQVGLATVMSVPIAVMTAVYLNEVKGRLAPLVRFIVDSMSGLPSIVAGLLIYTVWILALGNGFSGFACSLALLILMLPTVTRTAEEILRTVPGHLREAALALGASRWRTVARVVLPTARAGLLTAVILGVARAIGETAPAVLTAFGSATTNANPFNGAQADLPLTVFQLVRSGNKTQLERAYGGAFVLILLVLVAFATARVLSSRSERRLGKR
jgi:phosphate transport system permease protein